MRITSSLTDEALMSEIGTRLARARLDRGWTQEQLAGEAGVSKRTVERIESGASAQLVNLVRVLRTLGLLERLDHLLPEPGPSPIELLKLRGKMRKRASRRKPPASAGRSPEEWTWGEDDGA